MCLTNMLCHCQNTVMYHRPKVYLKEKKHICRAVSLPEQTTI